MNTNTKVISKLKKTQPFPVIDRGKVCVGLEKRMEMTRKRKTKKENKIAKGSGETVQRLRAPTEGLGI